MPAPRIRRMEQSRSGRLAGEVGSKNSSMPTNRYREINTEKSILKRRTNIMKRRAFFASMAGASVALAGCSKSGSAGKASGSGGELSLYTHNEVDEMKTL